MSADQPERDGDRETSYQSSAGWVDRSTAAWFLIEGADHRRLERGVGDDAVDVDR